MEAKISEKLKKLIVDTGRELYKQNLTLGTWGNISVLDSEAGLVYIKPSGMDYNEINPEDIIVVDKKGKTIEGFRKPSIEMPMHLSIYNARKDVGAIIHYHPIYSSVLAVTGFSLPGICEDFVQIVVEKTAHIYVLSKSVGKCRIIPEEDIKIMQDFAKNSYGK